MKLDMSNIYVKDFVFKLCCRRFAADGRDLAEEALQNAKETVKPSEYTDLNKFKDIVDSLYDIDASRLDNAQSSDLDAFNTCEKTVDETLLPAQCKTALYNKLLNVISNGELPNNRYYSILNKKIAVIPDNSDNELNITAKQLFFHRRDVDPAMVNLSMQRLYNKMHKKEDFEQCEFLHIPTKTSLDKAKSRKLMPEKNMTPKQRYERLKFITELCKNPEITAEERINLSKEALTLAHKNGYSNSWNFAIKRDLCHSLCEDYTSLGDNQQASLYEQETERWQKAVDCAVDYGRQKHGDDYFSR